MKKWIVALCCALAAAVIAIVAVLNNSNSRIDTLNQDLHSREAEISSLQEQAGEAEKTISDLTGQVESLTAEKEGLAAEKAGLIAENEGLAAENVRLTATLETVNQNLTSSQQKLQGVMYILTDGQQGSLEGFTSEAAMKVYQDVALDSPYFLAVNFVAGRGLMVPDSAEVFGVDAPATLGEFAESLNALQGVTGTREGAIAALLQAEKDWLDAQAAAARAEEEPVQELAPGEAAQAEAETAVKPDAEAPAGETAEAPAEAPAEETAEAPAETAAEEAAEAPAEAAAEAPAEAAAEAPAGEAAEAPAEAAAEAPAEAAAEAPAEAPAEVPAETAAEAPAETAAEAPAEANSSDTPAQETEITASSSRPATEATSSGVAMEDGADTEEITLTRERLLTLAQAVCSRNGWTLPEFTFPNPEAADATRGDLALVLQQFSR